MNFELFISKNIIRKGKDSLSAPAVRIAIVSIALGLSTMILSISILHGFQKEIRDKIAGFAAHITITSRSFNKSLEPTPVMMNQSFYPGLDTLEGIKHIQVFTTKGGILKTENQMEGVILKGVGKEYNWEILENWIIEGRLLQLYDSIRSTEILVSTSIANKLKLAVGDEVRMYFVMDGQNQPRGRKFEIVGIYSSGLETFDEHFIYGDLRQIQRLNNWPDDMVSGFEVLVDNFDEVDAITESIKPHIGTYLKPESIRKTEDQIFSWLDAQDMNVAVIMTLIIIVSVFSMISALLILILEKTNMIGILKALGTNNFSIQSIFFINGLYIIGKGLFWGNIIGIGIALLQINFHLVPLPVESYYVSHVPIDLNPILILLINLGVLVFSAAVLIVPAWIITRISPVNAIRFK